MGWNLGAFELQANGSNTNSGFFDASASFTSTLKPQTALVLHLQ